MRWMAQSLIRKDGKKADFNSKAILSVVALIVMTALYIFLIPRIGYLFASILFFIPVLLLFGLGKIWMVAALGIGVPMLFFAVFKFLLKVPLP